MAAPEIGLGMSKGASAGARRWPRMLEPHRWLYLLAAMLPFAPYVNLSAFPLSVSYIVIAIAATLWVLGGLASHRGQVFMPRELLPLSALLVVIAVMSIAGSQDWQASAILGIQMVAYATVFMVGSNVLGSERRIRRTVALALGGLSVSSLLGVAQSIVGSANPQIVVRIFYCGPLAELRLGSRALQRLGNYGLEGPVTLYRDASLEGIGHLFRAFGMFEGPVAYGFFSAFLAAFSLGMWLVPFRTSSRLRRRAGLAACATMAAVLLCWVRSAWLAVLLGALFLLVFRRAPSVSPSSGRWLIWIFVSVCALSLLILAAYSIPDSAVGRMVLSAVGGSGAVSSNAGRVRTALWALDYVRRNPMWGAGFGNYPYVTSAGHLGASVPTLATAHNTFLELAVELGLPGLIAYVWLLGVVMSGARELVEQPVGTYWHALGIALEAGWIAYGVISMFGGNIVHPKWMTCWWLMAGLQAAARRVLRRQRASTW